VLQNDQSCGPFSFSVCASLMRGCRHLSRLSFDCRDWSACVASESWGELPVPPADVIARGTVGVFEFVRASLHKSVICLGGSFFAVDCELIDLKSRNLGLKLLLPLLESFKQGTFRNLLTLNLVILFAFDVTAAHSHSCAAERKWYWRSRRRVDRRGVECQHPPAEAVSCKTNLHFMF
jgi:hypothetical protein